MKKIDEHFHHFKNTLADTLELPKDIMLNLPRVTMVGNIQAHIENHRGVVLYNGSEVRISLAKGLLLVFGDKLTIRTVEKDEITIDGKITAVKFKD